MVLADLSDAFSTVDAPCSSFIVSCPVSVEEHEKGTALSIFLLPNLGSTAFSSPIHAKLLSFSGHFPTHHNPDQVSGPANF